MATEKQIEANQKNAGKSSGPKTSEGRSAVAKNAMKHGLLSQATLIDGEDDNIFNKVRDELWMGLAPVGQLEAHFAERVVAYTWRLRRVFQIESTTLGKSEFLDTGSQTLHERVANRFSGYLGLQDLTRYETSIERMLVRALHELERLQARRAGATVPAPHSVDLMITG